VSAASAGKRVLVLHGPNLNFLGRREPEVYGITTLAEIDEELVRMGNDRGVEVVCHQSNHEGVLVDRIQEAADAFNALILNPAAYTHTSIAIRDALQMLSIPVVEIHLSNIHRREGFRRKSMTAGAATGLIAGFGAAGYRMALEAVCEMLKG
jgi:3-dehydroquinate dehydratase-2